MKTIATIAIITAIALLGLINKNLVTQNEILMANQTMTIRGIEAAMTNAQASVAASNIDSLPEEYGPGEATHETLPRKEIVEVVDRVLMTGNADTGKHGYMVNGTGGFHIVKLDAELGDEVRFLSEEMTEDGTIIYIPIPAPKLDAAISRL